ncbi:hypothetical protein AB0M92_07370 [Streptomyces sp. NPDC051582]|uniref:hypothetical protein n=1 Tax=Streptomyces sp. NPDC051582 TaxID=3155167 RepID=UPI00341B0EE1
MSAFFPIERFGDQASKLITAVPVQLAKAHSKARATRVAAELKKRSPYGVTRAEAVRENLADMARELQESVLFPFRYADKPKAMRLDSRRPYLDRRHSPRHR